MGKKDYFIFFGLAGELVGLILVLSYLGYQADKSYSLGGMGVVVGALLGMFIWIFHIIRAMKDLESKEK
jgi:F0F1-type ATP synthase assembly protein I